MIVDSTVIINIISFLNVITHWPLNFGDIEGGAGQHSGVPFSDSRDAGTEACHV